MGTTRAAVMDVDVISEQDYVNALLPNNMTTLNLVCQMLCKTYDGQLAVNDVSFSVAG